MVSPQGQARNAGEFILTGDESKLEATTPLQTFGMFVTAEPHFLAKSPSRFVVLENTRPEQNITGRMITTSTIQYRGFDGVYGFNRESLVGEAEVEGETRSDVRQAQARANEAARKDEMEARRRDEAEKKALQARRRADELAEAKFRAEFAAGVSKQAAERARRERDAARDRLKEALGKVADTRETARGLVVSLPDILFDFDQATLRPEARETLSKLCGVMLVTAGQSLSVEGYTDSVGSEEYNRELSERRA